MGINTMLCDENLGSIAYDLAVATDVINCLNEADKKVAEAKQVTKNALGRLVAHIRNIESSCGEEYLQGFLSDLYWSDRRLAGTIKKGGDRRFVPDPRVLVICCQGSRKCRNELPYLVESWQEVSERQKMAKKLSIGIIPQEAIETFLLEKRHKQYSEYVCCDTCVEASRMRDSQELAEREAAIRETEELRSMPYREYLLTEHWQETRERALWRADRQCRLCSSTEDLNVHHRTYERLGCEHNNDLTVLCRDCHAKFHDKLP